MQDLHQGLMPCRPQGDSPMWHQAVTFSIFSHRQACPAVLAVAAADHHASLLGEQKRPSPLSLSLLSFAFHVFSLLGAAGVSELEPMQINTVCGQRPGSQGTSAHCGYIQEVNHGLEVKQIFLSNVRRSILLERGIFSCLAHSQELQRRETTCYLNISNDAL